MDHYPKDLAPLLDEKRQFVEIFRAWWQRVGNSYPNVPRNVAKQWLYRHWGLSRYGFLPSDNATFTLVKWSPEDLKSLRVWRDNPENMIRQGRHLLAPPVKLPRPYRVPKIMRRRGVWPAPIIVLAHDGRFADGPLPDLPDGFVLIEGHRRAEVAMALAVDGMLTDVLPVWIISY